MSDGEEIQTLVTLTNGAIVYGILHHHHITVSEERILAIHTQMWSKFKILFILLSILFKMMRMLSLIFRRHGKEVITMKSSLSTKH